MRNMRTINEVADIFRNVLEADEVPADTDFFAAGGDSLLATRVLSAVTRRFGAELTIAEFIDASSPAALADLLERQPR